MCDPAADAGSSGSLKRQAAAWRAAHGSRRALELGCEPKLSVTVNGVQLVLLFGFVPLQDPFGWPRVFAMSCDIFVTCDSLCACDVFVRLSCGITFEDFI